MTQAVNLANFANNLDSSGGVSPSALNAAVPVSKGGTNATTAADARTNLGLGSIATQSASSVAITGGSIAGVTISGITDLAIADGGTGASTAAGARTNLDVPANDGTGATGTWAIDITGDSANGGVTSVNAKTGAVESVLTAGTAVLASGTNIDFTGIPSWAKRITVMFAGVSTAGGTDDILVQLGTSSGVVATGYDGAATAFSASANTSANSPNGLKFYVVNGTVDIASGIATITNLSSNTWVMSGVAGAYNNRGTTSGSSIDLGGVLDRIRITTENGTNTFDDGSINILYE